MRVSTNLRTFGEADYVYTYMCTTQASPIIDEAEELRTAYNSAFFNWVTEVRVLQGYVTDPSAKVEHLTLARKRTQQAEQIYRERRNQLLCRMSQDKDELDLGRMLLSDHSST